MFGIKRMADVIGNGFILTAQAAEMLAKVIQENNKLLAESNELKKQEAARRPTPLDLVKR